MFNYLFVIAVIFLFCLGYLAAVIMLKNRKIHCQQNDLRKHKDRDRTKRRRLAIIGAVLKGQEADRSRIASNLQNEIGSLLAGTSLAFASLQSEAKLSSEMSTRFDRFLILIDYALADIRKIVHSLLPEALEQFGLYEAVQDYCDHVKNCEGIFVEYHVLGEKKSIGSDTEVHVYRIIQELVTNTIKHAAATKLIVQLALYSERIFVTVEDNGRGFDTSRLCNIGSGLSNIKYRVSYLNGIYDIVTAPGNGTSVSIELKI